MGVHPPLELSHYQVKFAATSLYDMSVATLHVINSHVSMNSLTHSVPRIGSEDPSPVGPTSFEFLLPPDSPITISPSVGTVLPGKAGVSPAGRLGGGAPLGSQLCPALATGMQPGQQRRGELYPSSGPSRPKTVSMAHEPQPSPSPSGGGTQG